MDKRKLFLGIISGIALVLLSCFLQISYNFLDDPDSCGRYDFCYCDSNTTTVIFGSIEDELFECEVDNLSDCRNRANGCVMAPDNENSPLCPDSECFNPIALSIIIICAILMFLLLIVDILFIIHT